MPELAKLLHCGIRCAAVVFLFAAIKYELAPQLPQTHQCGHD